MMKRRLLTLTFACLCFKKSFLIKIIAARKAREVPSLTGVIQRVWNKILTFLFDKGNFE